MINIFKKLKELKEKIFVNEIKDDIKVPEKEKTFVNEIKNDTKVPEIKFWGSLNDIQAFKNRLRRRRIRRQMEMHIHKIQCRKKQIKN